MDYSQIGQVEAIRSRIAAGSVGSPATPAPGPAQRTEDASYYTKDGSFSLKLEKHIKDHYRGQGKLSGDVAQELGQRSRENARNLSPDDFSDYGAYLTVLNYGKRARFVSNMSAVLKFMDRIKAR